MADKLHLSLLGEGVKAWEQYRKHHPGTRLDLRDSDLSQFKLNGAHLIGAQLNNANLRGVNLYRSRLDFCDLSGAHMQGTDLRGACLANAKLRGADLKDSDLHLSILSKADFDEAILFSANFTSSHIEDTNFSKAYLQETIFVDLSLKTAKNLDECEHRGPSILDHRTIERSGNLPINFLRGCGLPELFIEYLPSLTNRPIQFHSCFISYSSNDEELAKRLYADLQDHGVRCWYAPEDMKIGDKFRSRIDEVIHMHEKLLLILSMSSIGSAWVEKEVETAFEKERENDSLMLFPIRLDNTVMDIRTGWAADIRRSRHIGDFTNWKNHDSYKDSFSRLLSDLKIEIAG